MSFLMADRDLLLEMQAKIDRLEKLEHRLQGAIANAQLDYAEAARKMREYEGTDRYVHHHGNMHTIRYALKELLWVCDGDMKRVPPYARLEDGKQGAPDVARALMGESGEATNG